MTWACSSQVTSPSQIRLISFLEDGVGFGKARVLGHGERFDAGGEQGVGHTKHTIDLINLGVGPCRFVTIRLLFAFEHHQHTSSHPRNRA